MTTFATVPLSAFEYRANFREPMLASWSRNGEVVAAVMRAFRPWNVTLNRVTSVPNPANLGQLQINFEVIPQRFVFSINIGATILSVWNPNWQEAATIREIAKSGTVATATNAMCRNRESAGHTVLSPDATGPNYPRTYGTIGSARRALRACT